MRATDAFGVSRGYEQYFGLVESPFSLTPNTRFLFESESHSQALEQVTLALRRREALTVITGEVGTGKTMLCRILIQDLEPRTFISIINNPLLTSDDLLKQLLHDFGLMSHDELHNATLSQHEMVAALQRFMASLIPLRAHAIVLIDEAQHLRPDVLEQVRLLSNFETENQKLLQIVLVGQLDLDELIERPDLRQLRQRISRRYQLQPLKPYEVEQYIERRLWVAHGGLGLAKADRPTEFATGERFWRVRFSAPAMRAIAQLSHGLPRSINVICDRALERAHLAQKKDIDAGIVLAAARDLKIGVPAAVRVRSTPWPAVAAAAALLVIAGGLALGPRPSAILGTPSQVAGVGQPGVDALPVSAAVTLPAANVANVQDAPAALQEVASFELTVASFRSQSRAEEVVRSLQQLDLPAYVHAAGGWHAVSVGPFASRAEAQEAQAEVARVHLTDSRITATAPAAGRVDTADDDAVATTGQKGQP